MSASTMPTSRPQVAQREREVDRQRRLADAALARGDGDHARARIDREALGRGPGAARAAASASAAALLPRPCARSAPATLLDARHGAAWWRTWASRFGLSGQPGTVSTISIVHVAAADRDRADHAELDDVAPQLGVDDPAHGLADRCFGRFAHGRIVSALRSGASQASSGWKTEPVEHLREEVRRLLRHRLACRRDRLDLGHGGRAQDQRHGASCGLGRHGLGRLYGAPAVTDAVRDGHRARIDAEHPVEHECADHRDVERAGGVRRERQRLDRDRLIAQREQGPAVAFSGPQAERPAVPWRGGERARARRYRPGRAPSQSESRPRARRCRAGSTRLTMRWVANGSRPGS